MSDCIEVTVLCFAGLKERIGKKEISLSMPAGTTCGQFKEQFLTSFPQIQKYASHLLVARQGHYLSDCDVLSHQDQLACFPPVSGG